MLDLSDIGISTGAYWESPLDVALGAHRRAGAGGRSLLVRTSLAARTRERALPSPPPACPSACTARSRTSSSPRRRTASTAVALDLHRRHMFAAAELGAFLYMVHPDLHRRARPWSAKIAAALERSFVELAVLQNELGVAVAVENMCPSRGTRTSPRRAISTSRA